MRRMGRGAAGRAGMERAEMIVMTMAVTRERDQAAKTQVEVERAKQVTHKPIPLLPEPEPVSTQRTPPAALLARKSSEVGDVATASD